MKILLLFTLICSFPSGDRTVYICNTKNAVAYHFKKDCSGLQRCRGTILRVTESEAKEKGLHVCGWEK